MSRSATLSRDPVAPRPPGCVLHSRPVTDEFWWHSIDLGDRVTPGSKSAELLEQEWRAMKLPSLLGRTVLDIGAWDGWFSFRAEAEGASRVVSLDHYVWSMDLPAQQRYYRDMLASGGETVPYELTEFWQPETLPGKRGFDTAHAALGSKVEPVVADFMTCDLAAVGAFDVVLFLGVLYHLTEPFAALRRLRAVTTGTAIIETVATDIDGPPLAEFFPGAELAGDASNWWAPNEAGLVAMCQAAGFASVTKVAAVEMQGRHSRIVVHAS